MHLLTESHVLYEHSSLCIKYQQLQKMNQITYSLTQITPNSLSLIMQTVVSVWLMMSASLRVGPLLVGMLIQPSSCGGGF